VSKTFGGVAPALADISMAIGDNEFFTLLGPSGCGKTTLLRILAGFEHPTAGRVLLDGSDIAALPPYKRPVNTMFQSYALFPHLSVAANVAFGLEMLRWKKADIDARVKLMLELVRLPHLAARRPTELSGGQQQRVALARALAPRPRVLLLDEPLSALDLKLRKEMQFELKRLQRETAITFVLVTHDQEEALAMSDRIAVMDAGRVQQIGGPRDIYEQPANRFVADFIGEANVIPAGMLARAGAAWVAVRPERMSLAAEGRLPGTLLASTYLGADTLHEVDCGTGRTIRVRSRGSDTLASGSAVCVDWPDEAERMLAS
jgi:spermidine/putrescine transport system ATP-binding protein